MVKEIAHNLSENPFLSGIQNPQSRLPNLLKRGKHLQTLYSSKAKIQDTTGREKEDKISYFVTHK